MAVGPLSRQFTQSLTLDLESVTLSKEYAVFGGNRTQVWRRYRMILINRTPCVLVNFSILSENFATRVLIFLVQRFICWALHWSISINYKLRIGNYFSVKAEIENIFSFVGHGVCFSDPHAIHVKAAIHDMETNVVTSCVNEKGRLDLADSGLSLTTPATHDWGCGKGNSAVPLKSRLQWMSL